MKAICLPSGDHAGSRSSKVASLVRLSSPEPSAPLISQISRSGSPTRSLKKAIFPGVAAEAKLGTNSASAAVAATRPIRNPNLISHPSRWTKVNLSLRRVPSQPPAPELETSPLPQAVDGPQHRPVAVLAELVAHVQRAGGEEQPEDADDDRGYEHLVRADRAESGEEHEQHDRAETEHRERSEHPAQHRSPPVTVVGTTVTLRPPPLRGIPKMP